MAIFHRLAHFSKPPSVKVGDWVKRGQLIGYCGTSGASSGPHCHWDIFRNALLGWTFYVYGWSLARVKGVFVDPSPWKSDDIPMKAELPRIGYRFLQAVRNSRHGLYFHTGEDLNGLNDYGKPVYSPTEGRVKYVSPALGRVWSAFGWQNWNQGWGWMVVIEEKPGFKI